MPNTLWLASIGLVAACLGGLLWVAGRILAQRAGAHSFDDKPDAGDMPAARGAGALAWAGLLFFALACGFFALSFILFLGQAMHWF